MGILGKTEDPENPPPGPIPLQQQPKRIQVVIPNFEVKSIRFLDETQMYEIFLHRRSVVRCLALQCCPAPAATPTSGPPSPPQPPPSAGSGSSCAAAAVLAAEYCHSSPTPSRYLIQNHIQMRQHLVNREFTINLGTWETH